MAIGFTGACMKFFGRKAGQGLQDFAKEIGALTIADKQDLKPLLEAALGESIELPTEVK